MDAATVFSLANLFALAGWVVLAAGVVLRSPLLRDRVAGLAWPFVLSVGYAGLVAWTLPGAEGGFGSLDAVWRLFQSPWLLLAGWVHYLAFDLFVGAWIARRTDKLGLSRWILVPILPATFLLGPAGLAAFLVVAALSGARPAAAARGAA